MMELSKKISFDVQLTDDMKGVLESNPLFASDSLIDRKCLRSIATSDRSEALPKLSSHTNISVSIELESSVMSWFMQKGI